jgi:thioredoxin 1
MKKSPARLLLLLAMIGFGMGLGSCSAKYKPLLSSQQGINFKVITFAQAKQMAKDERKALFIFEHASWCPTCKKMEQEVLIQKELGDVYNRDLINAAIDVDSPEGHRLRMQYPVRATPTLLFFKPDGTLAGKLEGFTNASDLLAEASQLKN